MDSVTQILLGSAVVAFVAPKSYRKRAIVTGTVLGTIPDLDVFLRYANDVENFTHHRGFSHSLFVLPIFSLFLMPLLRRFYPDISWARLYALIALGLITHPLLDTLTSYGTQLFYPLNYTPIFISSVLVIDPLYSLWLLIGLAMYWYSPRWQWVNTAGLIISTFYLGIGIGLQQFAKEQLVKAYPNTTSDQWFIGALSASPLCWHGVYKDKDTYLETAFNVLNPNDMAEQQYRILPPEQYPQSEKLKNLLWFNPNTILRSRNGQLISSDLRMGEFGIYAFEFIISPNNKDGEKLPMFDKPMWKPYKVNVAATEYAQRNSETTAPKRKWSQFLRCLQGST